MTDLAALPPKLQAPLAALDEGEQEEYREVLLDRSRPAQRLADVLTAAGFPVGPTTIKDFRRRAELNV